jgi:DNA-binding PadR family transcriptional regulator
MFFKAWRKARRDQQEKLEEDILQILEGRSMTCLEVEIALRDERGHTIRIGCLYPTIRDLECRGFLVAWWGESASDSPRPHRPRYYTASSGGKFVPEEVCLQA